MVSQLRPKSIKRATIKDVAHAAGVSVTTVSNVLNGRTEAMAEDTLQRIQQTIQQLNYRPSRVARSLVTQQTATLGVIISEIDTPLFLQALNHIETIARRAEYHILLATTAEHLDDEAQIIDLLLEKQVDGIIYLSTSVYAKTDFLEGLPPSAPPVVLVNRTTPFAGRFDRVNFDHLNGMTAVMDHLAQLGHCHIAHLLGPEDRASTHERLNGYRQGLARHNLPYRDDYVKSGDFEQDWRLWQESTLALLNVSPRPTAIIGANDRVAAVAMRTAQNAGLRVPQDVSIVGVDNQAFCNYLNPALTSVKLPVVEAGKLATNLLLERVAGHRRKTEHNVLPCLLVPRESSGVAP